MPVVQPAEMWQETGRWEKTGPSCCASRTGTSATSSCGRPPRRSITDIARKELRSYKQLPVNLYHIQTKFRDEVRPRFGVMRSREFIMKDAYSFDVDKAGDAEVVPGDVRRLWPHLHADGAQVPRGRGRHRRDRRQRVARVPGARRFGRGRDRLVPRVRLRGQCRARRGGRASRRRGPPRASRCRRCPRPGKSTCEEVAELLGLPLARTVKCIMLVRRDGASVHMLLDPRRSHAATRSRSPRCRASAGFRWASDAEIVAATGCKPGYLGPVGIPADMPLDRRPHGRGHGRFRLRRQRGRFPPARRQLRPRLPRAGPASPTSATSSRATRRPTARGRSRSSAASRSATSSRWATVYSEAHGCNLSRRRRSIAGHGDGLLRDRRHPRRRRGDRAEPRRPGYHLAAAAGAVHRRDRPRRVRPQRGRQGARRPAARRAGGGRHRGAARRPGRASWRDVC